MSAAPGVARPARRGRRDQETSVIFAALIGMIFLKERFGARRVAAAVVIAVGIVLISA
jgi:drug/metabolite transporter (DMT)-like permease